MNTSDPEPQGGTSQKITRIFFYDRAGNPISQQTVVHYPLRLQTGKDGGVTISHLNGSSISILGENVRKLVREGLGPVNTKLSVIEQSFKRV